LCSIKKRPLAEGDMCIEKCDQGHKRIVRIGRAMAKPTRLARSCEQSADQPSASGLSLDSDSRRIGKSVRRTTKERFASPR
jgi:hypothetical protein